MSESLDGLTLYRRGNHRICPSPVRWKEVWEPLTERRRDSALDTYVRPNRKWCAVRDLASTSCQKITRRGVAYQMLRRTSLFLLATPRQHMARKRLESFSFQRTLTPLV